MKDDKIFFKSCLTFLAPPALLPRDVTARVITGLGGVVVKGLVPE